MIHYLDTSAWIAWKFGQTGQEKFLEIDFEKDTVIASPLLVSEYVAFLGREKLLTETRFEDELGFIHWIYPSDPLFQESLECVRAYAVKGADLHHLATALWFSQDSRDELYFLTCDHQQEAAAKKLGFQTV